MISPHTQPGTRVICIENNGMESVITLGGLYIVEQTVLLPLARSSDTGQIFLNVVAVQVRGVWCPNCKTHLANFELKSFDYAALPESITDQLDAKPVDIPGLVSVP